MGENETTKFVLSIKCQEAASRRGAARWNECVIGGSYESYSSFEDNTKTTRCRRQESDTPNTKSIAPTDEKEHYRRDIPWLKQSNAPQED